MVTHPFSQLVRVLWGREVGLLWLPLLTVEGMGGRVAAGDHEPPPIQCQLVADAQLIVCQGLATRQLCPAG